METKVNAVAVPTSTRKTRKAPKKASAKKSLHLVKKTTKKASKKTARAARTRIAPETVIVKVATKNPRREGTNGYKSFSLIKNGMTVGKFVALKGRLVDLRWDAAKGNVKLKKAS